MKKNFLKGGKSDKLSINDIAKKHKVSIEYIKKQIELGIKVESEHTNRKDVALEIVMDHLEEIKDYYTKLNKMEKTSKKELTNEAKRFMALSGIKEGEKKFLTNEIFSEKTIKESKQKETDDDFIILEFDRVDVEPGEDDSAYKINMSEDKN